jgi:two-component system response regulator MprA
VIEPFVVVCEDDLELRSVLERGLREEGFRVEGVGAGAAVLALVEQQVPDVLIVDIGLPDADGRDVCQAIRARGIQAPVLFLTARDALTDRLGGFRSGGDDYVTKPFAFEEIVERVRALARRGGAETSIELGSLRLDPAAHAASSGDVEVALTPTEFRLLARLASAPGDAVRRRQLIEAAWPHGAIVHDNTLDAYVARLRRKLRTLPDAPVIRTVHGVGYAIR